MIGKKIGHYHITDKIGEGGMGVVYKAHDTKLDRDIALKVLPPAFTEDEDRLLRFEREAKVLASLNHSNIAAIYGVEEYETRQLLVLELVPGETLADHIRKRRIDLAETLDIFRQIASGLEAAHEIGVIHRDLKPANIKIRPKGQVKILDFGLAKSFGGSLVSDEQLDDSTIVQTLTGEGVIFGTASYMSPEQARGKSLDRRADIWAFGCMLFEALTGQRIFKGETVPEVLSSVLSSEPAWTALPDTIPASILDLLKRCLRKDPSKRLRDMGDIRITLEEVAEEFMPPAAVPESAVAFERSAVQRNLPWVITAACLLIAALAVWSPWIQPMEILPQTVKKFQMIVPPLNVYGPSGRSSNIALSPDGSRMVFVVDTGSTTQLYLREMDQAQARPITGTEGAITPFFDPGGEWVGYFDSESQHISKVSLLGAPPRSVCSAPDVRGADWGENDIIVYSPAQNTGLHMVSSSGSTPQQLTQPDFAAGEKSHRLPELLPGGKAIVFTIGSGNIDSWDSATIAVVSINSREQKVLIEGGTNPRYSPTGHLIFARAGGLYAVPFDVARLETTGVPVLVRQGVVTSEVFGGAQFTFSGEGSLAYVPGGPDMPIRSLVWVHRDGSEGAINAPAQYYYGPRISPNGQEVAVTIGRANDEIWVYGLERGELVRRMFGGGDASRALWMPDSEHLVFVANTATQSKVSMMRADGGGPPEDLIQRTHNQYPGCVSSDGKWLIYVEQPLVTGSDIWAFEFGSATEPWAYAQTTAIETMPSLSPDSKWLAYVTNESGRFEIVVQSFPEPRGKHQISISGGPEPVWSSDGKELFFRRGNGIMVVTIEATDPEFRASSPVLLFETLSIEVRQFRSYDYSPRRDQFLIVKSLERSQVIQVDIVLNWFEELNRLVPMEK